MIANHPQPLSHAVDATAAAAIVAAIMQWVPPAVALLALCWYLIQIYESKTVQRWLACRRLKKKRKR